MAGLNNELYSRLRYDVREFNFPNIVSSMIGESSLCDLSGDRIELRLRETDQKTKWHERYYSLFQESLSMLYQSFVLKQISPLFPEPIYFQSIPSLRIHLPNNLAVGEFHRDIDYGHPQEEVNFWLPLTKANGTSAPLIEDGDGSLVSLNSDVGEILSFDAANRRHGNVINTTGQSRVSIDFRVLPVSKWYATESRSVNTKLHFSPGSFYSGLPS